MQAAWFRYVAARAASPVLAFVLACGVPMPAGAEEAVCSDCHDIDQAAFEEGSHGLLDCVDCHAKAEPAPHDEIDPVACADCHDEEVAEHRDSVHQDSSVGKPENLPTCHSCHGAIHGLVSADDPRSPVYVSRQAETCGSCHSNAEMFAGTSVHTVRPIEAYQASVHARALAGGKKAASCSACHTSHSIRRTNDPESTVFRDNIVATCGSCHESIAESFAHSVHGMAARDGVRESPVCTDCHGEHRILSPKDSDSPVFASNIPVQTCGHCHGDLHLTEKFGLATDKVPAYADSYHGLAMRGGRQQVANCASCHGVHDILPSSDAASHVHPDNLAVTCGNCHPGAGARFKIGPVHVVAEMSPATVGHYVRLVYLPLIWLVIGGMFAHNLLDLVKKARLRVARRASHAANIEILERMPVAFRVSHVLVAVSFTVLAYSGFALKYPEAWWALPFAWVEGDTDVRGIVHRGAGVMMLAALMFHLLHLLVSRSARRRIALFVPRLADFTELKERMAYNLGLSPQPPGQVSVGYIEKSEYWAFMWGTVITAGTGLLLWFDDFTLAWLPGWVPEAATALHFYEAILAALAILVWHLYWVMMDPVVYPMDTAWITGKPPVGRAEERGEIIAGEAEDTRRGERE
jgi:cytochrome b subunit of formate dehydrogenase